MDEKFWGRTSGTLKLHGEFHEYWQIKDCCVFAARLSAIVQWVSGACPQHEKMHGYVDWHGWPWPNAQPCLTRCGELRQL